VQFVAAQAQRIFAAGLQRFAKIHHLAIHARAYQALTLQRLGHILVETLARAHHGGAQHHALAAERLDQRVGDLRCAAGLDRLAAGAALLVHMPAGGRAAARPQQSHVVVDLGGGGHGAAWRVAATALLDGDGGGQALDALHIGLAHLVQELSRVRGQAFHVLALAFGEDGVERQAALAAARHTREHHQLVAGQ
jgi:hypothetical protein